MNLTEVYAKELQYAQEKYAQEKWPESKYGKVPKSKPPPRFHRDWGRLPAGVNGESLNFDLGNGFITIPFMTTDKKLFRMHEVGAKVADAVAAADDFFPWPRL
jgi:hypothetical protein